MESHRQKFLGENSDKQLFSAPGFRAAAVVAVEVEQGTVREAGTASIFVQGCTNLAPSPVQELLKPLFTCHAYCYLKIVSSKLKELEARPSHQSRETVSGGLGGG